MLVVVGGKEEDLLLLLFLLLIQWDRSDEWEHIIMGYAWAIRREFLLIGQEYSMNLTPLVASRPRVCHFPHGWFRQSVQIAVVPFQSEGRLSR